MMETPNLDYINTISDGDIEFKEKFIAVIKNEFPDEVKEYKNNLKNKKYQLVAENVHKIKHKISILGLEKSYEIAANYEEELKRGEETLSNSFNSILDIISNFIKEI